MARPYRFGKFVRLPTRRTTPTITTPTARQANHVIRPTQRVANHNHLAAVSTTITSGAINHSAIFVIVVLALPLVRADKTSPAGREGPP